MRRMKKSEQIELINKRAYEFAKSGKYNDYSSIEIALRADGFIYARRELDDDRKRKELNELCKIANSESEIENRKLFDEWIQNFVAQNIDTAKSSYPELKYSLGADKFHLRGPKKELQIHKVFGQRKLIGDLIEEESDGSRYRLFDNYHSSKDFDQFNVEDIISLVKKVL